MSGKNGGIEDREGGGHDSQLGAHNAPKDGGTAATGNLFGGMDLVRTRHKRTTGSTGGSRTPLAQSLTPLNPRDAASTETSTNGNNVFVTGLNLQLGVVQDEVEDPRAAQMRQRLQRFFNEYNPSMLPQVEKTIKMFTGREEELFSSLVAKYGPEPTLLQASALPVSQVCFHGVDSEGSSAFDFVASGVKKLHEGSCSSNKNLNAVNVAEASSFSFLQGDGHGARVTQSTAAGTGFTFIDSTVKNGDSFVFTTANLGGGEGELHVITPPASLSSAPLPSLERDVTQTNNEADKNENNPHLPQFHDANNLAIKEASNDSNGSEKHEAGGEPLEELWERQRREIQSSQEDVLLAQTRFCSVLGDIRVSIQQRHDMMQKVAELERRMDQYVAQEAFEQAGVLCEEIEQLAAFVAELDLKPKRLVASLGECCEQLLSAIRNMALLLRQHRQELIESKDDEERRVKEFIHYTAVEFKERDDKLVSALEEAQQMERCATEEVAKLSERKSMIGNKLVERCSELRSLQEKLQCERNIIDADIADVEAKLAVLRQASAEKAAALNSVATSLHDLMAERELCETEVDKLIEKEVCRHHSAATLVARLQQDNENLRHEWCAFNRKEEVLLEELQKSVEKMDSYEELCTSLESETLTAVHDYSEAVGSLLQLRSSGCGVLFSAPPSSAAGCMEESPLAQVQLLQQQLRTLDADDERNKAVFASLTLRIGELHNSLLALDLAKRSAVQAKQFKEAHVKAEEVRALTACMKELTATSESAQAALRANESKRVSLQQKLVTEHARSVEQVQSFLSRYGAALSAMMERATEFPNVPQLTAEEKGHHDLMEVVRQLMTLLHEEYQRVLQEGRFLSTGFPEEKLTHEQLEAEFIELRERQQLALEAENFEECDRLQCRMDIVEEKLSNLEEGAKSDSSVLEEPN